MNQELHNSDNNYLSKNNNSADYENKSILEQENRDFETTSTGFENNYNESVKKASKVLGIRPNKIRAEIAQLFILAVAGIEIISIVSSYMQIQLLNAMQNGEEVTDLMIDANDTREQWMGISYTVLIVLSAFTFILWFRRAYYNLSLRTSIDHSDAWAAGSWFVPLLNLFRPYQIMNELFTKTTNLINRKSTHFTKNDSTLIGVWWTLWIVGNYVARLFTRAARNADTIEKLLYSTKVDIVISAFMVFLSIIAILMIKAYSEKEEKLSELENNSNGDNSTPIINSVQI